MRKFFVIDTSVLLYDGNSVSSFSGNDVILPITVIDELDRNKQRPGIVGENARYVNRFLDSLRESGRLDKGVKLPNNDQTIRIATQEPQELAGELDLDTKLGDNRIISVALGLRAQFKRKPVIVVTKDINLRVKCDALGIQAEDYYKDHVAVDDRLLYNDVPIIEMPHDDIEDIYGGEVLLFDGDKLGLHENDYLVCKSDAGGSALCRYQDGRIRKISLPTFKRLGSGISPKNKEQHFALDALHDPDLSLICLTGIAGSGKTYLTLMSALEALYSNRYDRIIVTRSIQPVGRDLGYLPGDMKEKMAPWMAPLVDNFRQAFKDMSYFEMMMSKGQIDIAPLSYIRGRTFNDAFIIVDEAQNTTIHELKTIITRVGMNSKIVLMGDTDQVDTPYIDRRSNGLSIVINKMRDSGIMAHVHLSKGERSELATMASNLL